MVTFVAKLMKQKIMQAKSSECGRSARALVLATFWCPAYPTSAFPSTIAWDLGDFDTVHSPFHEAAALPKMFLFATADMRSFY